MYNNVDSNHCPKVRKEDIISEEKEIEKGMVFEPINQLELESNIQFAISPW